MIQSISPHFRPHRHQAPANWLFPGTERYTPEGGKPGLESHGRRKPRAEARYGGPHSETSMRERAGLCNLESTHQDFKDAVRPLALQMRKEA